MKIPFCSFERNGISKKSNLAHVCTALTAVKVLYYMSPPRPKEVLKFFLWKDDLFFIYAATLLDVHELNKMARSSKLHKHFKSIIYKRSHQTEVFILA